MFGMPEPLLPETEESLPSMEDTLLAAMREPRRNRLDHWAQALEEHRRHPSFRTQGWAWTREVGFTCECGGCEQEWRVSLVSLREMLPEARDAFMRLYDRGFEPTRQAARVAARKQKGIDRRAKALLHRHLTREQRWELRATRSITVTGQDGRTYLITEGTCNNVFLMEDGRQRFRLCAVASLEGTQSLPAHDLMLAQKLTIEHDIRRYLSVANAMNVETGHTFAGRLLLEDMWPEEVFRKVRVEDLEDLEDIRYRVPDDVLDDPSEWIAERLALVHEGEENADADGEAGNGDGRDRPHRAERGLEALLGQGQP